MQIAVLADIHGNLAALEAVAADLVSRTLDAVIVAGDTVNRGPRPGECWEFVKEHAAAAGWQILLGNHEEYVLDVLRDPSDRAGIEGAIRNSVRWTAQRVIDPASFATLPKILRLADPTGAEFRVTHASMRGTRDNVLARNTDDLLREQIAPAPAVFCCGHTHVPFIRQLDTTLIINVGSVGMPFDGDVRACYSVLTWRGTWHAELIRIAYDRERAAQDFITTDFLTDCGPVAELIYDEFVHARPRLFGWFSGYQSRVLAGELTVADSLHTYLTDLATQAT